MADLKTDYKDDVLDADQNLNRTFDIKDANGNILYEGVTLEETTKFIQQGDIHFAQITNEQNTEINQLNQHLTANTKSFQFTYDSTKQKYGYTIDGIFYPFSSGAVKVGTYSSNTTIDVSAYSPTSVNQFIAVAKANTGSVTYGDNLSAARGVILTFTPPSLSLSGNLLSVTIGNVFCRITAWGGSTQATHSIKIPCDVYYVGDIESAS